MVAAFFYASDIDKIGVWCYNSLEETNKPCLAYIVIMADLSRYKENNSIEAKKATGGLPRSVWETYSAFANTTGGVILLGVAERKDKTLYAVDLPDPQRLIAQFLDGLNDKGKVSVNLLSARDVCIEEEDGREIVVIHVPQAAKSQRPVYVGGDPFTGTYYRKGEADLRCTKKTVERMLKEAKL